MAAGERFGSYEVTGALGAGGMGEVYRAHDPALGRDVAIKVLPESFTSDANRVARFEQEAKTLAALGDRGLRSLRETGTAKPEEAVCDRYRVSIIWLCDRILRKHSC
jgi:serine/threonine protein kinase